ncbi:MAG: hypothetical protein GC193_09600 [Cryomorphaceae bacterium]|nr:hypothetical protein [Cryomorphaceae bacterium]
MKTRHFIVLAALLFIALGAEAQCVMCKAVAEDSAADGGLARGLNSGILYLMAIPYILLGTLYFVFFRKKKIFKSHV